MKKISYLFGAAVVALAVSFTSCSKSDNPVDNPAEDPVPAEPVYEEVFTVDFAAAAAAGENPANFNGNQNNGQGFNAYNVKIRNDYKGYTWAEGSVLPEVCHVYRRSDRINGNIVEGGLNCPNDREFAIDGLEAGYVVEITYTGDNAIIWAPGENDAEGNAVGVGEGTPVATATIDGVEAVPGETAIPSGAKIELKTVTPAVKGDGGYIVIQVKKGQVISKIAVTKLAE